MFKKFVAALAALLAATAFAAVDVNKATQAELEAISGIGPSISASIISERKKGEFKDWNDLVTRIKGVGDRSAAKFSQGGLTVAGKPYSGAPYVEPAKPATAAKTPTAVKAASGAARAGEAPKATASKAASGVKGGSKAAKEEKDTAKASGADSKAVPADKKATEKADATAAKKAEAKPAAASASAAKK
jgi:competence protein ComEA